MKPTVLIASDHAGYALKSQILTWLNQAGYTYEDFGTHSEASMDYPDVVHPLCQKLITDTEKYVGILLCGSGNGVCMTANKYPTVRAALCWDVPLAALAKQHNNANVICIPARFLSAEKALQIVETFLQTSFEGGRHEKRVQKIKPPC